MLHVAIIAAAALLAGPQQPHPAGQAAKAPSQGLTVGRHLNNHTVIIPLGYE